MATIAAMPEADIINGFKGVLDYYVYRGIPCVRRWPRYTPRTPTQAEASSQAAFSEAVAEWNNITPYVRSRYASMSSASTLSARDIFIKMYINGKSILPY